MVGSGLNLLAVGERHPEHGLPSVAVHIDNPRVLEFERVFVHLTELHAPHAVTPVEQIALLVRATPVLGRLEALPDILHAELVELVPAAGHSAR